MLREVNQSKASHHLRGISGKIVISCMDFAAGALTACIRTNQFEATSREAKTQGAAKVVRDFQDEDKQICVLYASQLYTTSSNHRATWTTREIQLHRDHQQLQPRATSSNSRKAYITGIYGYTGTASFGRVTSLSTAGTPSKYPGAALIQPRSFVHCIGYK